MRRYYDHFWTMHWMGMVLWILFIAAFIFIIWKIADNRKKENIPLDILKERFARGEITKEEFEEQKRILRG